MKLEEQKEKSKINVDKFHEYFLHWNLRNEIIQFTQKR